MLNANQPVIERLEKLIKTGDEVDRCFSLTALAKIGGANSETLSPYLRDEDIDVCVEAAQVLGSIGDDHAALKLRESYINDPDPEVKKACIRALSELDITCLKEDTANKVVETLMETSEKPPENMHFQADDWDLWWDMQLDAVKGLGRMQVARAVPVLSRLLDTDEGKTIESEILFSLAYMGKEGEQALLKLLSHETDRLRRRSVMALGRHCSLDGIKAIGRALRDPCGPVRIAALETLEKRGIVAYTGVVLAMFRDPDTEVRDAAVRAATTFSQIKKVPKEEQLALINQLLKQLDSDDQQLIGTVLATLYSLDYQPNEAMQDYLVKLVGLSNGNCFSAVNAYLLSANIEAAIPSLLAVIENPAVSDEKRLTALETLGRFKYWNNDIRQALLQRIHDPIKVIRLGALQALSELGQTPTLSGLPAENNEAESEPLSALSIEDPISLLIQALNGQIEAPQEKVDDEETVESTPPCAMSCSEHAEETVEDMAGDKAEDNDAQGESTDDEAQKRYVEHALGEIEASLKRGEQAQPMSTLDAIAISSVSQKLKQEQKEDEPFSLSEDEQEALKEFTALADKNREIANWLFSREKVDVMMDIRRLAARSLGQIKPESAAAKAALPELMSTLQEEDSGLKREAILTLGKLLAKYPAQHQELADRLIEQLDDADRDLRIAAARVLGQIAKADAIDALRGKSHDPENAMQMQVIHSLSQIIGRTDKVAPELIESLAEHCLQRLVETEPVIQRGAADALPLLLEHPAFNNHYEQFKRRSIESLIKGGLSGRDGQVKTMTTGMRSIDTGLANQRLLDQLDELGSSVERAYVVRMLQALNSNPSNQE